MYHLKAVIETITLSDIPQFKHVPLKFKDKDDEEEWKKVLAKIKKIGKV